MEDKLVYLFAAYTIIWVAVFIYAFSLARRQRDLQREIESMREVLQGQQAEQTGVTRIDVSPVRSS